jgi:uncharacterized membrane protein HdeD (DUF308 family)
MRIHRSTDLHGRRAAVADRAAFLTEKPPMTVPNNLGMLLLAIWLILFGVLTTPFLGVTFSHSGDVLGVLAIVTGILLIMKR